jgi:hypothetical protein
MIEVDRGAQYVFKRERLHPSRQHSASTLAPSPLVAGRRRLDIAVPYTVPGDWLVISKPLTKMNSQDSIRVVGTVETRKVHMVERDTRSSIHDSATRISIRSPPAPRNQEAWKQTPMAIAPQVFKWMQDDDAESTKRVRRHVMADYMRKKRAIAEAKLNKPSSRVMGWRKVESKATGESQSQNEELRKKVIIRRKPLSKPILVERFTSRNVRSRDARNKRPVRANHVPRKLSRDRAEQGNGSSQLVGLRFGYPSPASSSPSSTSFISYPSNSLRQSPIHRLPTSRGEFTSRDTSSDYPSPSSPLGAGVVDPFDCFPVSLKQSDRVLINHCTSRPPFIFSSSLMWSFLRQPFSPSNALPLKGNQLRRHPDLSTLPSQIYQMGVVADDIPHKLTFRRISMHHPMAFEAMLALASKHRALAKGLDDTVQSLDHKAKAIRFVNERLRDPDLAYKDETIYAVATLSTIEKFTNNLDGERMHYKGMVHMMKQRGGLKGMQQTNDLLEKMFYW